MEPTDGGETAVERKRVWWRLKARFWLRWGDVMTEGRLAFPKMEMMQAKQAGEGDTKTRPEEKVPSQAQFQYSPHPSPRTMSHFPSLVLLLFSSDHRRWDVCTQLCLSQDSGLL